MTPNFSALGVPAPIVGVLERSGVTAPFEIQAAVIPDALAGRDVCGRAPTGSGKTLAFGIPLAATVDRAEPRRPRALVLAPTRELAEQIHCEISPLAAVAGRRMLAVYGGIGMEPQRARLRRGVDILVACPGRLADLVGQGAVRLDSVDRVVVDEADRMADMGFLPEVRRLLDMTARDRQTLLFSATLDGDVAVLTREYQHHPVRHEVGSAEPDITSMRHLFWRVERTERVSRTAEVVSAEGRTVVFCRTRHGADRTASQLVRAGVAAAPIHGGRSQGQRRRALESFAAGRTHALVATDVAARGIHVDGVACVVHFDPPEDHKAYLHRSGRTARAGASGVVVSLVADSQLGDMKAMQRRLGLPMGFDGSTVATTEAELLTAAHTQSRHGSQGRTGNGAGRPSGSRRASSRRGARRGATAGRQGSGRRGSGRQGSGRQGSGRRG